MKQYIYLLAMGIVVVTSCFGELDNRPFSGQADIQGQFVSSVNADLAWIALDEDLQHSARVEDNGSFELHAVPVGEQILLAADGLGGARRLSVTLLRNRPNPVRVQVQAGAQIKGRVEIRSHEHQNEIRVGILGLDQLNSNLDDNGFFKFSGLPKSCYTLWIDSSTCPRQQTQVCVEQTQIAERTFNLNNCRERDAGDNHDDAGNQNDTSFFADAGFADRSSENDAGNQNDASFIRDAGFADRSSEDDAGQARDSGPFDREFFSDIQAVFDTSSPDAENSDASLSDIDPQDSAAENDAASADAMMAEDAGERDVQDMPDRQQDRDSGANNDDDFCQICHGSSDCNAGFCTSAMAEENGARICTRHCNEDENCPDGYTCKNNDIDGKICLPRGISCIELNHLGQSCGISIPCGFLWNPETCQQGQCSMSCNQDSPCPQGFECQLEDAGDTGFCK